MDETPGNGHHVSTNVAFIAVFARVSNDTLWAESVRAAFFAAFNKVVAFEPAVRTSG